MNRLFAIFSLYLHLFAQEALINNIIKCDLFAEKSLNITQRVFPKFHMNLSETLYYNYVQKY